MLEPRMNQYATEREPIGTPAVRTSLKEDLYLSVMNIDPERGHARAAGDGQPDGGMPVAGHGGDGARAA